MYWHFDDLIVYVFYKLGKVTFGSHRNASLFVTWNKYNWRSSYVLALWWLNCLRLLSKWYCKFLHCSFCWLCLHGAFFLKIILLALILPTLTYYTNSLGYNSHSISISFHLQPEGLGSLSGIDDLASTFAKVNIYLCIIYYFLIVVFICINHEWSIEIWVICLPYRVY